MGDAVEFKRGNLIEALSRLDSFAQQADFILGHNFIHFDAKHLEHAKSDLRLLKKPIIDTLWLNPLAFPRNPYHQPGESIIRTDACRPGT